MGTYGGLYAATLAIKKARVRIPVSDSECQDLSKVYHVASDSGMWFLRARKKPTGHKNYWLVVDLPL
jgi:hypothetical protein